MGGPLTQVQSSTVVLSNTGSINSIRHSPISSVALPLDLHGEGSGLPLHDIQLLLRAVQEENSRIKSDMLKLQSENLSLVKMVEDQELERLTRKIHERAMKKFEIPHSCMYDSSNSSACASPCKSPPKGLRSSSNRNNHHFQISVPSSWNNSSAGTPSKRKTAKRQSGVVGSKLYLFITDVVPYMLQLLLAIGFTLGVVYKLCIIWKGDDLQYSMYSTYDAPATAALIVGSIYFAGILILQWLEAQKERNAWDNLPHSVVEVIV